MRPNEPVQQMQHARGFIVGCANRVTLISWEAEHTEQQIGQAFIGKKATLSAYYKVIGYMFAKQFYWYKLQRATCLQSNSIGTNFSGLHVYKAILLVQLRGLLFKLRAILLVQMARAFVQT